jgi:hypothetical protein
LVVCNIAEMRRRRLNPLVRSAIFFSIYPSNLQRLLKIVKIEFHFFKFFLKVQIKMFFFQHILTLLERHICAGAEFFLIENLLLIGPGLSKCDKRHGVMKAHHGVMEAHHEAMEAHHGATEAHPGAIEGHPGAMEAQPAVVCGGSAWSL